MAIKFKYCRIQGKELAANTMTGVDDNIVIEEVQKAWGPNDVY